MVNKVGTRRIATSYTQTYRDSGGTDVFGQYRPPSESETTFHNVQEVAFSRLGDDFPHHKALMRRGHILIGNYTMLDTQFVVSPFKAKAKFWYNPGWQPQGTIEYGLYGQLPLPTLTIPPALSTQAENQARSIFVSRAQAQITSLQGGVVLGELRETLRLIRRPAQGMRNLFDDHVKTLRRDKRKLRGASRRRRSQYLTDQWLETSFGARPLLSDTKSAAEALARLVNGTNPGSKIKGFGNDHDQVSLSPGNILTNGPLRVGYSRRITDDWRATAWGEVRTEAAASPLDIVGLNFDHFLPTIWELIPYSFLIDYFSNVGQCVQAVSFCTSRLRYWGLSSLANRVFWTFVHSDLTNKSDPAYIESSVSLGETVAKSIRFSRINSANLVPDFTVHLPWSSYQWANIGALVNSARRLTPF